MLNLVPDLIGDYFSISLKEFNCAAEYSHSAAIILLYCQPPSAERSIIDMQIFA